MPIHTDLVTGWLEYQRRLHGSPHERHTLQAAHPAHVYASWTEVATRVTQGGQPALDLILALVETAMSDEHLSLVGTGPLEDLVHKHGNILADEVALLAASSERPISVCRMCPLSRVMVANQMRCVPPEMHARIRTSMSTRCC